MKKIGSQGPKVQLSKNLSKKQIEQEIPEEPQLIYKTLQLNSRKSSQQLRFDKKGRQIMQGTNYGISFDNLVTVCVFDPADEVIQIKETLSQCQNIIEAKINHKKSLSLEDTLNSNKQSNLQSILKPTQLYF